MTVHVVEVLSVFSILCPEGCSPSLSICGTQQEAFVACQALPPRPFALEIINHKVVLHSCTPP